MILWSFAGKNMEVSASRVEGFSKLSYSAQLETEDKERDKVSYKAMKHKRAREIQLDVPLYAALNVDVRAEVEEWMELCESGTKSKLYISGEPMNDSEYLLTSVKVDQVNVAPNGTWAHAEMALDFEETGADGGSSTSTATGGSSSKKSSTTSSKKTSVKTTTAGGGGTASAGSGRTTFGVGRAQATKSALDAYEQQKRKALATAAALGLKAASKKTVTTVKYASMPVSAKAHD